MSELRLRRISSRVATSWLLVKNIKRKVCVSPGVSPEEKPKVIHYKNTAERSGITHWNDKYEGQQWRIPNKNVKRQFNINSDVYLDRFDRLHAATEAERLRKKNHINLCHDNARPHVVESIDNKDLLPLSTFSPNEVPATSIGHWLTGKRRKFMIIYMLKRGEAIRVLNFSPVKQIVHQPNNFVDAFRHVINIFGVTIYQNLLSFLRSLILSFEKKI